jgi:hypothetical protein
MMVMHRYRSRTALLLAWLWFLPNGVRADDLVQKQGKAVLRLEAKKIESGVITLALSDEIKVTVSIEGRPGLEMNQQAMASREWRERRRSDIHKVLVGTGGLERLEQSFYISPFEAGQVLLQVNPLRYGEPGDSQWHVIRWQPVVCHVTTVVADPDVAQLRDITPPEDLPARPSPWGRIFLAMGVLGATGLLIGAGEYLRRRISHRPALPPDQWALRELDRLERLELRSRGDIERFYIQLSSLIRKYVELHFGVPAPARTTAEFVVLFDGIAALSPEQRTAIADILRQCDLVKFAKISQAAEVCRSLALKSRTWIKETTNKTEPGPRA